MAKPISLLPGAGERLADKLAGAPESERRRVLEEAMRAEFRNASNRIGEAIAAATKPSEVEELRAARARVPAEMMLMAEEMIDDANFIMGDPATVSNRLAVLEARWRETGNAVYVWRALHQLLNVRRAGAEALPPWCTAYIATAARNLAQVERQARPHKADKRQRFGNRIAAALLLTRRGANAFIAAMREDRRVEVARIAALMRSFGFSAARANAQASRLIHVNEQRAQQRNVARGRAAQNVSKPEG